MPDSGSYSAGSDDRFEQAVADAIARGREERERLVLKVELAAIGIRAAAEQAQAWSSGRDASAVLEALRRLASDVSEGLTEESERASAEADTFNIALFGRTGAGKSSLVTALGRLDGNRISEGESDWTTTVERVQWRNVILLDTPGINGWGRTRTRDVLERTARDAVEASDVVLLCFDTQNQQAEEFRKVAAWVKAYGKPCVAVLNVRNPRWRDTARVPGLQHRATLSRAVREHAGNVRDGLAAVGLTDVPVVAIGAQTAVFATAAEPLAAHLADRARRRRATEGIEALRERSLFPRIELLLSAMIENGAVDLRSASLRDGTRQSIMRARREMGASQDQLRTLAATAERTLAGSLSVLGYPDEDQRRTHFADSRVQTDLLTETEALRGEPFRTPLHGELEQYVGQLFSAHMHPLRQQALTSAEDLVDRAFSERRSVSDEEFLKAVFQAEKVEDTGTKVFDLAVEFARDRLGMEFADAHADITFESAAVRFDGSAGSTARFWGVAARAGGLLTGAGAGIYAVGAIANWWNPVGWVFLGAGVVSAVLGFLGRRRQKRAEEQRVKARAQAVAGARRTVHECMDRIEAQVTNDIVATIWRESSPVLRRLASEAIGLRKATAALHRLDGDLGRTVASVPPAGSATLVVDEARRHVQSLLQLPGGAPGVWLGEDWLHDPAENCTDAESGKSDWRFHQRPPQMEDLLSGVQADAAGRWITRFEAAAAAHPELKLLLDALRLEHEGLTPGVALVGDYSTGKSALIKRLLAEFGRPIPPHLIVGGAPVTGVASRYDLGGVTLVDTPGAQSGRPDHEAEAARSLAAAAVALMVYQPNLIVGDDAWASAVLAGDNGGPPLLPHTLFVVNRSDELGGDPDHDPEGFLTMARRKTDELQQALANRTRERISPSRILIVSGDPFGLVGDSQGTTPSDYPDTTHWDGIDALTDLLRDGREALASSGTQAAVIRDGCHRVAGRRTELSEKMKRLETEKRALLRLAGSLARAEESAAVLRGSLRNRLERLVRDHAAECTQQVLEAHGDVELRAAQDRLATWWDDPQLQAELDRFAASAQRDCQAPLWVTT